MKNLKKAQLINQYFGIYGYGNFDITTEEFAEILKLIEEPDAKKLLKTFYERLEKLRMG